MRAFLTAILISILALMLAACSSDDSSTSPGPDPSSEDGTSGGSDPGDADDGNTDPGDDDPDLSSFASARLAAVNAEREATGAPPLTWNDHLEAAALGHTQDMADNNFLSHTGSDGSSMSQRIQDAGYDYHACAENIAVGQTSIEQVMNAWMNSSGHRTNILNSSYEHLGAARVGNYWTQNFGAGGAGSTTEAVTAPVGDG